MDKETNTKIQGYLSRMDEKRLVKKIFKIFDNRLKAYGNRFKEGHQSGWAESPFWFKGADQNTGYTWKISSDFKKKQTETADKRR